MKTIIIYESIHGSTEKCALLLSEKIRSELEIKRLKDNENLSVENYDTVIIGGSIHHGFIQSRIESYIEKNLEYLKDKNLGLYLCCMEEGNAAQQQFDTAFPEVLRNKAVAKGLFGGEFNMKKMNSFERKIARKATGISASYSKINTEEISVFAEKINGLFS